jgi:hypothetical protein
MFNENTSQWDKTITIRKYGDTVWGLPSKEIIQYMRDVFLVILMGFGDFFVLKIVVLFLMRGWSHIFMIKG